MMSIVLSKLPAWLESLPLPLSDPNSGIVLLSGDGQQVTVPAVVLLSNSHLVRTLLTDHLPPAYSFPAISLPSVPGQVLQLVEQLCTGGWACGGHERKVEVEDVFKMLNVSCQLECNGGGEHLREIKIEAEDGFGEAAEVVQTVNLDLSCQLEASYSIGLHEFVQAQGSNEEAEAQYIENIISDKVELKEEERSVPNDINEHMKKVKVESVDVIEGSAATHLVKFKITRQDTGQRKHVCHECGKGFKTKYRLGQHSSVHTKVRSYLCDKCGNNYATAAGLVAHKKDKHLGVKYQCEECGRQFGKKCNLTSHVNQVHVGARLYDCKTCGLTFPRRERLILHIRVVHENRKDYKCEYCNMMFGRVRNRTEHIERFHVDTIYPCTWPNCAYNGQTRLALKNHMCVHDKKEKYWCAPCKIGFATSSIKKQHMQAVHPSKLHPCTLPECSFITSSKHHLKNHTIRAHTK